MDTLSPIIERVTLVAPLGVRFWDAVTDTVIAADLQVTAYPAGASARRVSGILNHVGVYTFQHLPGMHDLEQGTGDAEYWPHRPVPRPFVIEVGDLTGRFLPFQFTVGLPVQRVYVWDCPPGASPLASATRGVPLFSAPSRPIPSGMAVLRADLWDALADAPAAGGVLEAWTAGRLWARGLADGKGRTTLIFPYPEPVAPALGSPLGALPPVADQTWPLALRAFYQYQSPVGTTPFPDLCIALSQQPAQLWADPARTRPLPEITLRFARECIVRSSDSAGAPLSVVLLTPG